MNENSVLYALSTLAQTCAALAAFVGAIGLFRLQALLEARRSGEENFRNALVLTGVINSAQARLLTLRDILHQFEQARANPSGVLSGGGFPVVAEAFNAWNDLGPNLRQTTTAFVVFEVWNLFVILISLGGFAHVPALTCAPWAPWALWFVAFATVIISGVSLFVWLKQRLQR